MTRNCFGEKVENKICTVKAKTCSLFSVLPEGTWGDVLSLLDVQFELEF